MSFLHLSLFSYFNSKISVLFFFQNEGDITNKLKNSAIILIESIFIRNFAEYKRLYKCLQSET